MDYNNIVYPRLVEAEAKIGVTAMSSGLDDERGRIKLSSAIKNFSNRGFEILETPNVRMGSKLVSGNAKDRANEFVNLWQRKDIPYVIIACGGEFLMETLPYLHENKEIFFNCESKWIQGFSDVSLLNFYLTTNYNIATIHSNSFSSYAMIPWDKTMEVPLKLVMTKDAFKQESFELYEKERDRSAGAECNPFNLTEKVVYKNLYVDSISDVSIKFDGRLIGGCIDVLKTIIGTPFDNTKSFCNSFEEGVIWYLENCEMSVADLKRALWQMKYAGWFGNVKGFVFGRTMIKDAFDDFTYEDALHDVLDDLRVPVIYDADFGHVAPQWTMINGAFAEFEYKNGKASIKQSMI